MAVARCLAEGGDAKSWNALGLTDDDLDSDLDVLADNLPAVHVFLAMQTQWRTGMAGPSGLDYAALPAVFGLYGVKKKQRPEVFGALRVMEGETLSVWAEQREQRP